MLDRVVREEAIDHIVVSCDDVTKPLLANELPKHLSEKIVDIVPMDIKAPEHEVLRLTLEALRANDAKTDQESVEAMIGAWRAAGLAVAGPEDTLEALQMGQVEELIITATPGGLRPELGDELVTKAHATSARIRFIENSDLLSEVGGVGALLRFRI